MALALAVSFSAFTKAAPSKFVANWYSYTATGSQTVTSRETASNYTLITGSPSCIPGSNNECAVELNQSTTTPDFTNITFDASTGFPNGNKPTHSDFVANDLKN